MAVKLSKSAFEHAKELVGKGKVVVDETDAWSGHQPSAQEENESIDARGFGEYGKWHWGIDDDEPTNTKKHYKFPYGDFETVHRCALLSAESRAGQSKPFYIKPPPAHFIAIIDDLHHKPALHPLQL